MPRLLQTTGLDAATSHLDWLRAGPVSKRPQGLADHIAKVSFLKALGADRLALGLSLAGLRHYARPMLYRKPAALPLMREPRRTLELACFLRLQLLRLTDSGLDLLDHRVADLWRSARDRAEDRQGQQLRRHRETADGSRVARLAGVRVYRAGLVAQGDAPAHHDQCRLLPRVAASRATHAGGGRSIERARL